MKKLGIYIHIPFCYSRCIYCDFASTTFGRKEQDEYTIAICNEIKKFAKKYNEIKDSGNDIEVVKEDSVMQDYVVDTIYFGGGTPSLLIESNFVKIVTAIKQNFECEIEEFSVEVNPNTATESLFKCYKSCGVTRISFGAQTLNNKILKVVGRAHNCNDVVNAVDMSNKFGFDTSVDLMLGLPYQTCQDVKEFAQVLSPKVGHVSTYMLKVEEGTRLSQQVSCGEIVTPDDDATVDMYDVAYAMLTKQGFERYEVSNFCKAGKQSKHNLKYWRCDEYIGFGLSSHSFFGQKRFFNTSDFAQYLEQNKCVNSRCEDFENCKSDDKKNENLRSVEGADDCQNKLGDYIVEENVTQDELLNEVVMLGLRLEEGIDIDCINKKFEIDFEKKYKNAMDKCKEYMVFENNVLKIKPQYFNVMNSILIEFV